MSLTGVDVSNFQGLPGDWRVAAGNIDWAAVKLTELGADGSRYVNPDAAADWSYLKSAGKGRLAYLFGHASTPPTTTVTLFAATLRAMGLEDGDAVCLDHEVSDGLSASAVAAWGRTVLALLRDELDRVPLLYTFLSFAESGNCAGMGGYPLWIADPSSPEGHPRIPAPWVSHAIHQYVITGPIDRDLAVYPDLASMRSALGKKAPVPPAAPAPVLHVTGGDGTLTELAAARKIPPSTIIRITTEQTPGQYPKNVGDWLNAVLEGTVSPSANLPAGLHLYLPGS